MYHFNKSTTFFSKEISKLVFLSLCERCVSQVRDFDQFSRDTVLGEVKVPLDQLKTSYPVELQEDLQIPQKVLKNTQNAHMFTQQNQDKWTFILNTHEVLF